MRDKAQLFLVSDLADLVTLQGVALGDAATELNVFAVKPGRRAQVAAALAGEERPSLQAVLQGDELYIDFCIANDMGFYDAFLIRSPAPIAPRLTPLLERFERAIQTYAARLEGVNNMSAAAAAAALHSLAQAKDDTGR